MEMRILSQQELMKWLLHRIHCRSGGAPTFALFVSVQIRDLSVVDVNQDNVPDIVSIDTTGNQVVFALNQGGGTPGQHLCTILNQLGSRSIANVLEMGDLNRDNVPDLGR